MKSNLHLRNASILRVYMDFFKLSCFLLLLNTVYAQYGMKPEWAPAYSVVGRMIDPFSGVREPFSAYYDLVTGQSRIDFFDGKTKMFQFLNKEKFGSPLKVVLVSSPTDNMETNTTVKCHEVNGNETFNISLQAVLPDLENYYFGKRIIEKNKIIEQWTSTKTMINVVERREIWIVYKDDVMYPTMFIKFAHNPKTLQYYDNYLILYDNFISIPPDQSILNIDDLGCESSPLGLEHIYSYNPMMELFDTTDKYFNTIFDEFRNHYNKDYGIGSYQYFDYRLNFLRNLRYIHSINRANVGYKLAVNHLADYSERELKSIYGYKKVKKGRYGNGHFPYRKYNYRTNFPDYINWNTSGAVTAVKDQGMACNSSWTFSTTGTLEGAYFLKYHVLKNFSQQALIDCTWFFENEGCAGGEDSQVYRWMEYRGIPSEDEYGPYLFQNDVCRLDNVNDSVIISDFVYVPTLDEESLKIALFERGPISITIHASLKSFIFYANGVYSDSECVATELDHYALLVGYGTQDGEPYWLIKNSWSSNWGDNGYIRISRKNNTCGVLTAPTYVVL